MRIRLKSTITARVLLLAVVIVTTSTRSEAAVPSLDELIEKMEAARKTIDQFSCRFTVTKQVQVRSIRDAEGDLQPVPLDDPAEYPPPRIRSFNVTVSGKQFRKALLAPAGSAVIREETWDGSQLIQIMPESGRAAIANRLGSEDMSLADPRDFAYNLTPIASIPGLLRSFPHPEQISVRETAHDGDPVLLVEAVSAQPSTAGVRVWIDPARGFLPVQIERTWGPDVTDRYTEVEHRKVDGVWFPVAGIFQNIISRGADAYRNRIASSTGMQVDPATIKLDPPIGADTFSLVLPAGTDVINMTTRQQYTQGETTDNDVSRQSDRDRATSAATRPASVTQPRSHRRLGSR